jgi:D-alanyl-D-alanine carboxypeptidase (penicillin-binding protein 5/6)
VVTLAVIAALSLASGIIVAQRLHARPPLAVVSSTLVSSRLVGGTAPALPWPAGVQSAIAIPALGVATQSGPEAAEPIASVTKLMTAHIVLTDHPLMVGQQGPTITITALDVIIWQDAVATDQANIEVSVGEVLTEYQMLEGMLVHSANNFADLLALWDAGSISSFVTKMNSTATSLGMTHTQYADASGYSTQSISTPADQLKVATADVANPVFNQIVAMPAVTLPVGGTVTTFTPLLGVDGVVGVKSGYTSAAGGCDVLALLQMVDGVPVEVLAAVVGDHVGADVITGAGLEALSIARPAMAEVRSIDLAPSGTQLAVATASGHSVPVVARSDLTVLAWPGQRITEFLQVARRPSAGTPAGWPIGTVTVRAGPEKFQVVVRTARALPSLTWLQRVF